MTRVLGIILPAILLFAGCQQLAATHEQRTKPQPIQISLPGVDAAEPATVAAEDGEFYVAWVNHDLKHADVMLARFNEKGEMQGSPSRVNRAAGAATAWRGDQPSLAVAPDGAVLVLWTERIQEGEKRGTNIMLSTSRDRGKTFVSEVKVNDDKSINDHGMHSLAVAGDGRIYAGWLDERNVTEPKPSTKAEGHHVESNRDFYFAFSTDGGQSFSANRKVATEACPCCKTAMTIASDGTLFAGWRQVLPGDFRHIAVATSRDEGTTFSASKIVSDDQWVIHGCPVSGPSLSVDAASGNLRVVWFAAGEGQKPGLYFAESSDKGQSFSPRQMLAQESVHGTPAITAGKHETVALWQKADSLETKMRRLGNAGSVLSVALNGELPSASFVNENLFVAYIAKEKENRSIWLIRAE